MLESDTGRVEDQTGENSSKKVFRIDEIINHLGCGLFQVLLFVFCGLWYLVEACELMILSLLMPNLRRSWNLSKFQETMIASVILFGVVFGAAIFGFISDRFGRKKSIIIAVFSTLFFGVVSAFSNNYYLFLFVRFFVGICVGSAYAPYSLLIEYLPNKRRGMILVLLGMCWAIGSVYEALLGWAILPNFGSQSWQYYVGFSLLPLLLSLPMLYYLPESIRYLSLKCEGENREKNERTVRNTIRRIERLNFRKLCEDDEEYTIDFTQPDGHKTNFFSEVLRSPSLFLIFANICVFNISAGFLYYSFMLITPDLFENKEGGGEDQDMMYFGTLFNAAMELACTLYLLFTIYFFNRKTVFSFSFGMAALALLILAVPLKYPHVPLLLLTFAGRFFITAGCCVCVITSQESLPTNVRGRGFGLAYSLSKFFSAFSPFLAKMAEKHVAMAILAVISITTVISAVLHPRETKMKSLVDIFKTSKRNVVKDGVGGEEETNDECRIPLLLENKNKKNDGDEIDEDDWLVMNMVDDDDNDDGVGET